MAYLFEYISSTANSFFKKVMIKENAITFFTHSLKLKETYLELIALWGNLKQCNTECVEQPFEHLAEGIEFALMKSDIESIGGNHTYITVAQCGLVKPEDFSCILEQMQKIQINPDMRSEYYKQDAERLLGLAMFIKSGVNELKSKIEYFSADDMKKMNQTFADYYNNNTLELHNQYQAHCNQVKEVKQKIAEIKAQHDVFLNDLYNSVWYSAAYSIGSAALVTSLVEILVARNWSRKDAEFFVMTVNLGLMACMDTTWYPFMVGVVMLGLTRAIGTTSSMPRAVLNMMSVLSAVTQQFPVSTYSAISLGLNVCTSMLSYSATKMVTQAFWQTFVFTPPAVAALPAAPEVKLHHA